jgi:hypothetical protein
MGELCKKSQCSFGRGFFVLIVDFNIGNYPDIEFDYCIIGAGAAGISLALSLGSDKNVALIESGGYEYEQDYQLLNEGFTSGVNYLPLIATRLRQFGGTTGHWAGQSAPFEEIDFQYRPWVENSGWPISYYDYMKYLPKAAEFCGVAYGEFTWEHFLDNLSTKNPFGSSPIRTPLFRYSHPARRFGEYFRSNIGRLKNIFCHIHSNVTEIDLDIQGRIKSILIESVSGNKQKVISKNYILASGGIENSRILLNVKRKYPMIDKFDQIGRYYMEHPNVDIGIVSLFNKDYGNVLSEPLKRKQKANKVRFDFQLAPSLQEKLGILNHSAFLIPENSITAHRFSDIALLQKLVSKFENVYDKYVAKEREKYFKLRVRLEQAPISSNRIVLTDQKDFFGQFKINVNNEMSNLENITLHEFVKSIAHVFGVEEIGRIKFDFTKDDNSWMNRCGWQIHHCGGTRMSNKKDNGVVDENLKMHFIDNLWVVGSSVFPTSGHANPTMNLIALSLRLADHLNKKFN